VEVITLKNRTPNPIAALFVDELRTLATPLTKRAAKGRNFRER
jgi:hypothetical protein